MTSSESFDPYLEWLGIQPHEHPVDHYRLLGINQFEKDDRVISNAADQRMMYVRTFQSGPRAELSQKILNELSAARICLLNPEKKEVYDERLQSEAVTRLDPALAQSIPLAIPVAPQAKPSPPPPASPTSSDVSDADDVSASELTVPHITPASVPQEPRHKQASSRAVSSRRATARQTRRQAGAIALPAWFPVVAVIGVIAVAGLVWGIGTTLMNQGGVAAKNASPQSESSGNGSTESSPAADSAPVKIYQEGNGNIHFPASVAKIHGNSPQTTFANGESVIENWRSTDDWLEWQFLVITPGMFRVVTSYSLDRDSQGGIYELAVGDHVEQTTVLAGDSGAVRSDECQLIVPKAGSYQLKLRAAAITGERFIVLRSVRMGPVK